MHKNINKDITSLNFKKFYIFIIVTLFLFSCFSIQYQYYVYSTPFIPDPQPFVSPRTPLSVNITSTLVIKQVQITSSAVPMWLFRAISLSDLVENTSIQVKTLRLPDTNHSNGIVNYLLIFPNGTKYDCGAFNASWYEFYFSPFIFTDWKGWKQYFSAWKAGNIIDQNYAPYSDFNYTIYETKDYFGIITNIKPDYNNNEIYSSIREFAQKLWFNKHTGALVYEYWYSNYTVIYHDSTKTPYIYAFLVETYDPLTDFAQINTGNQINSENHAIFDLSFPATTYTFIIIAIFSIGSKRLVKKKIF